MQFYGLKITDVWAFRRVPTWFRADWDLTAGAIAEYRQMQDAMAKAKAREDEWG